jgi:putative aldouronate transport system substrate-binding protein
MKWQTLAAALLAATVLAGSAWATGKQEKTAGEKMEISLIAYNNRGSPTPENSRVQKYLEDHFNIKIKPWTVDWNETAQINVRIASGDIPDVWMAYAFPLQQMGAIREVPKDALYKYMPKYMQQCDELGGKDLWQSTVLPDGKNWGIPTALSIAAAGPAMIIRGDWLAKLGWTKSLETLDDIESLFLKFRNEDPDGNKAKDTYAYTGYKNSTAIYETTFAQVFGAYGVRVLTWEKKGDHIEHSMVSPAYRDALKRLQSWYKNEIIHPEFAVQVRKQIDALMANNQVGAFEDWSNWLANFTTTGAWGGITKANPAQKPVYVVSPKGPTGLKGNYSRAAAPWNEPEVFGVNVSDKKLFRILQIIEELYSDIKLYAVMYAGFEGEEFTWTPDGLLQPIPITTEQEKKLEAEKGPLGRGYFRVNSVLPSIEKAYTAPARYPIDNWIRANQVKLDYGFTPTFNEDLRVKNSNVVTLMTQFYYNAITGKINIDAEWNTYVDNWMKQGGKELLEEASKQYVKSLK